MNTMQILRLAVNERLTTAAKEICGVVERTISAYEEELSLFKQEVDRQRRLLDAVLQPQVVLNVQDIPQFTQFEVKQEYEDPLDGPAAWNPSLGSTGNWSTWRKPTLVTQTQGEHANSTERPPACQTDSFDDLLNSGCEMEEGGPPKLQECQQLSPSQDQEEPARKTPEQQGIHDGCKQMDEPLAEGEQKNVDGEPRYRDPNQLFRLRVCAVLDPTIQTVKLYKGSAFPVKVLKMRFGLQEDEFLKLMRTTFPELADKPFAALKINHKKQLCPVIVDKLTPERISTSRCLGRSALYLRVKNIDYSLAEGEQNIIDGHHWKSNKLFQFRIGILMDPTIQTITFYRGSYCRVKKLKVRFGLQEEEFLKFLRTSFPQLADKPFDALRIDKYRNLWPLNLNKFTPEQIITSQCLGRSALYIRVKEMDNPMAEGAQENTLSVSTLYSLRTCFLPDPTMRTLGMVPKECQVKVLKVPLGLREEQFKRLLRTTFPQLADKPFDLLKTNSRRRLFPLKVDKLTPERIIRSQCLGRSALYIRLKEEDDTMDDEEHAKLRVCLLHEPTMSTSEVSKDFHVKELTVPYGLQQEEFQNLLRTTFPQLADKPFEALRRMRSGKFSPLGIDKLTPAEIITSRRLWRSPLYIRLKAEDQCQTSQDGVQLQSLEKAKRGAENKGGDPVPSASGDEEVKMVPVRGDCGQPEPTSQPVPSHCSGSKQLQEDCDEHCKKSWNPTEKCLDNNNSVELPSTSLQAEGALQHKGEDCCESEAVEERQVSSDHFGVANGDDGSIYLDDHDIDADNDDDKNDNDADDDDDWKMSGGSQGTSDCERVESEAKLKQNTIKNDHGRRRRSTNPPLFCKVCEAIFYLQACLIKHAQTHADDGATVEFPCGVCGQISKSREGLMDHLQYHRGDKLYQCDVCHKGFTLATSLKRHAIIHTGEKPYSCTLCGKCFNDISGLRIHRVCIHTKERNHACTECGKRFKLRCHLKGHMMVHSEERPYLCDICSKTFKSLNGLKQHLKAHSGERPYCCSVCGKCFTFEKTFKSHMIVHTGERPFSCSDCGQRFRCKYKLRYHKRCHTGEKPYACIYCSKTFRVKPFLTVHLRTHTGKKPYRCNICCKGFTQSHCLKSHRKVHKREAMQTS